MHAQFPVLIQIAVPSPAVGNPVNQQPVGLPLGSQDNGQTPLPGLDDRDDVHSPLLLIDDDSPWTDGEN